MLTLEQLCREINLPEEVTKKVMNQQKELDFSQLKNELDLLWSDSTWDKGVEELKKVLSPDMNGYKMLTCMLVAGLQTYEKYLEKGIDERIFFDTFGCFARFVKEHKISYGDYGFDREFWTSRQIALVLYRIDELEYEFTYHKGQKVVSLHIPSDSTMTIENCRKSYERAKDFIATYYPDYQDKDFVCESWLLSPNLKDVLDEKSRILQFQSAFTITDIEPEAKDYLEWVFKNRDLSLDQVPQETSLQRKMKAYLVGGGLIGHAFGILKTDAFE